MNSIILIVLASFFVAALVCQVSVNQGLSQRLAFLERNALADKEALVSYGKWIGNQIRSIQKQKHRKKEQEKKMSRIFAIPDIHGRADLLEKLINKLTEEWLYSPTIRHRRVLGLLLCAELVRTGELPWEVK